MGFFSSLGSIGGFLGGVGSLVGGIMGSSSQSSANKANAALANAQFQFQKDYIKNQLQWKVDDAQKAGLHPMAALGIQSPGFSPVSSNQTGVDYSWLGDIGQVANYASTIGKTKSQQKDMLELQVRGLELDNEYKQAQIDQMRVDTLASTIASDQALNSPGAPPLNSQSPIGASDVTTNTYGDRVHNLYSLASYGDIMLSVLNPDIADSLTESQISHLTTILAREVEHGRNPEIYRDALERLPKEKQKAVADGRAVFEYIPAAGVYMLTYPQKRSKNGREISGKLRLE